MSATDWTRESERVLTMTVGGEVYVTRTLWLSMGVERRDPRGLAWIGAVTLDRGSGVALELAKALVLAHARILAEERAESEAQDRASERMQAAREDADPVAEATVEEDEEGPGEDE